MGSFLLLWPCSAGRSRECMKTFCLCIDPGLHAGLLCRIHCLCLQASVLKLWTEERKGQVPPGAAKGMAEALAAANASATKGEYQGPHPSITSAAGTLRETFRGWRTDVP